MEIKSVEQLESLFKKPSHLAVKKVLGSLDANCRQLIGLSPFVLISSSDSKARADISPKGDPPGFVKVLDEKTLLIPERPGNNRLDTFRNLLENPRVGLLFLVPGSTITLRVSGTAKIVTDPELLAQTAVKGKTPVAGLLVEVEEVHLQCPKCILRSELWNPDHFENAAQLPSLGQMLADQISGVDATKAEERIKEISRTQLY